MSKQYSKKGLWTLFLMCAFPLHVWAFILSFMDFSWVAERTNTWDALGVISYGFSLSFPGWADSPHSFNSRCPYPAPGSYLFLCSRLDRTVFIISCILSVS